MAGRHVGVIAIGNALGNSIVSAQVNARNERVAEQERMSAAIGQIGQSAVDANLNARLENATSASLANAQQQGAANLNRVVSQQRAQSDAEFETSIVASQNEGAQRASNFVNQSDAYFRQGNVLASRHLQQMQGIQESAYNSFTAGEARGMAKYTNGMNQRGDLGLSSNEIAQSAYEQSAYENAAWADGKARARSFNDGLQYVGDTVKNSFSFYKDAIVNWPGNLGNAILDALPDEGGFTFTKIGQIQGNLGIGGVATAIPNLDGDFYSVDWKNKGVTVGKFTSFQGGGEFNLVPFSASAGMDFSVLFDGGDFNNSVAGSYLATGGEGALGFKFEGEYLHTLPSKLGDPTYSGLSVNISASSPSLEVHSNVGYGKITGTPRFVPFSEIPHEIYKYYWGNN